MLVRSAQAGKFIRGGRGADAETSRQKSGKGDLEVKRVRPDVTRRVGFDVVIRAEGGCGAACRGA